MLTVLKMLAVFALLGGTLLLLRRTDRRRQGGGGGGRHAARAVEVLGQARLSKGATVALVRVGGSAYAVGVTDSGVRLLGESFLAASEGVAPVAELEAGGVSPGGDPDPPVSAPARPAALPPGAPPPVAAVATGHGRPGSGPGAAAAATTGRATARNGPGVADAFSPALWSRAALNLAGLSRPAPDRRRDARPSGLSALRRQARMLRGGAVVTQLDLTDRVTDGSATPPPARMPGISQRI